MRELDLEVFGGPPGLTAACRQCRAASQEAARRRWKGVGLWPRGGLGEIEEALGYLKISIVRREAENMSLKIDPRFAALRTDPRFPQLIAEVGL